MSFHACQNYPIREEIEEVDLFQAYDATFLINVEIF